MKYILSFCLFFSVSLLICQKPSFQWSLHFGGSGTEKTRAMASDDSGNIYSVGGFYGNVDFNPGQGTHIMNAAYGNNTFILKLNASGQFVWARQIAGISPNEAYGIICDRSGNIVVTGTFSGYIDFDPGQGTAALISKGNDDVFTLKMTASGKFIWVKQTGGSGWDGVAGIASDSAGNIYTCGSFSDSVDFDPGSGTYKLSASGNGNAYVSKLDSAGNFIWAVNYGGTGIVANRCLVTDRNGNVYTGGAFSSKADFNPDPSDSFILSSAPGGYQDAFLCKFDKNGRFGWAAGFGAGDNDEISSLAADLSGNLYSTGRFYGTVDFDPGSPVFNLSHSGFGDVFILKLDTTGRFRWAKKIGNNQDDKGTAIQLDSMGNVYTAGWFFGEVDFDPGAGTYNLGSFNNSDDIFILKLDSSGNFKWANIYGYDQDDHAETMICNRDGSLVMSGFFRGRVDFNHGPGKSELNSGFNSDDIFLLKLGICNTVYTNISDTACTSYTIAGNTYTQSGNYLIPLLSQQTACDSIINLSLHIIPPGKNNISHTVCRGNSYTLNGVTYTTGGTYTQNLVSYLDCDSIITLTLSFNQTNKSVTVNGSTLTAASTTSSYQWISCADSSVIQGAVSRTFTPGNSGSYAVILTQNTCRDTSACYTVRGTGLEGISLSSPSMVFPNPVSDVLHVRTPAGNGFRWQITDVFGKVISSGRLGDSDAVVIPAGTLHAGLYFITLITGETAETIRFMKL